MNGARLKRQLQRMRTASGVVFKALTRRFRRQTQNHVDGRIPPPFTLSIPYAKDIR